MIAFLPHPLEGTKLSPSGDVPVRVVGMMEPPEWTPLWPDTSQWLVVLPNGRPEWVEFERIHLSAMRAAV